MHILVTGAAGFIASKVCEQLLDDRHSVLGVDNLNEAYDRRLKEWRLARLDGRGGFSFVRLDICDRAALENEVFADGSFDAVINLAARAGVRQSVDDPFVYAEANYQGTLNLLELSRKFDVTKFVLASSSSLYGAGNTMPYREDQHTDRPLSPYAATKKAAETMCYAYHYLHGLDVTIFRYFTVYGPAGRPDMSPFRFTQWIAEGRPVTVFGDGSQSRDFTYVDDIAEGTVAGLRPLGYEIINLGSDAPVALIDAIRMMEKALGKKANLKFAKRHRADVQATWADISKAERLLEWRPQTDLRSGIEKMVAWYGENRDWAKEISTD